MRTILSDDLSKVFRASPAASLVLQPNVPNFTIVEVSDAFLSLAGLVREEVVGKRLFDIFPDSPSSVNLTDLTFSLLYVLENKKRHSVGIQKSLVARKVLNDRYWIQENIPVMEGDRVTYIIYSITDVTHRMLADKYNDVSKQLLLQTEIIGGVFSWQWNITTGEVTYSKGIYQFLGISGESIYLSGDYIYSLIHEKDRAYMKGLWKHLQAHPQAVNTSVRIQRPSGDIVTCIVRGEPRTNESGEMTMIGHVIDISEKSQLEETRYERDRLFRNAFEFSALGMALLDREGKYTKVNKSLCEITGYDESTLLKLKVFDITFADDQAADYRIFKDLIEGKTRTAHREKRYHHRDGQIVWASVRISAITDIDLKFQYFMVQVENITDRKRVELELQKSEQEYRSLFEQNPDPVFSINNEGAFVSVNRAAATLFGEPFDRLFGKQFLDFCLPEQRIVANESFETAGQGRAANFDIEIVDSSRRTVLLNITPIPIVVNGAIQGLYCIAKDITDKRLLERAVQTERRRFSDMFTTAPVSMCILKGDTFVFEKANEMYYKLSGRSNIIGKPVREVFPEAEGQGIFELMNLVYRSGETYSTMERLVQIDVNGDGKLEDIYLNFMFQPYRNSLNEIEGIFFFGVDVTEQVIARKQIEQREKQYYELIHHLPVAVFTSDSNGKIRIYNKAAVALWGTEPKPDSYHGEWQIHDIHGNPISHDATPMARVLAGHTRYQREEILIKRVDGELRMVLPFPSPLYDVNGKISGAINVFIDITERKKAEEELKKLSLIARKTTNAVLVTDPGGVIEWVNEAFTHLTGFSFEEAIGKKPSNLLHGPKTNPSTRQFIQDQIEKHMPFECEILKYDKSGNEFWVEVQGQPLFDENGYLERYFHVETDITESKKAYEELLKKENEIRSFAKQLNDVLEDERSRIAREIHDELGQQLTGLKMSLSSLRKMKTGDETFRGIVTDILTGIETTIQSLRNFSTELRPGILDTLGMIPSIEWLVREFEKKSGITCSLKVKVRQNVFEKTISTTYFRICQEALTNILKHAEATKVMIEVAQVQNRLSLVVADNGKGIATEKMNDHYSMGLLGMRERAKLIGGDLEIDSQRGAGTSIKITAKLNGG
jgi:PAS domain S-box-containing protein